VSSWLNVTPDHLDRYAGSYERYIAAKCRVFENQRSGDSIIYNSDDDAVQRYVEGLAHPAVRKLGFGRKEPVGEGAYVSNDIMHFRLGAVEEEVIESKQVTIRGIHNLYNAMAAALVARTMGIPTASIRSTLRNFKGVEHRLEFVREVQGVTYVNDSKATNVDSVWYALQSFNRPIVLFLGGRDKGNDYSRLTDLVRTRVKAIVAIGESADKVERAFGGLVKVAKANDMAGAVQNATRLAAPGDVVLLSPACASFDWFENYEHRGRVFKQIVNGLKMNGSHAA
jgi:UDP-N-acetylmuramoylalanine--D-glutamate ligase